MKLNGIRGGLRRIRMLSVLLVLQAVACDGGTARPAASDNADSAAAPTDPAADGNAGASLIPATAGIDRVADLVHDPRTAAASQMTRADSQVARMVQRGYEIFRNTPDAAPRYSGNGMTCSSCHLNAGQKEAAWPLVGVATLFPQYRERTGRLITLQDRIADCFERSMNGTAPPHDSEEMLAVSAYLTWLSRGQPAGMTPAWLGVNEIPAAARIAIADLRPDSGRVLYERICVACHGTDGQGVDLGVAHAAPLWGPRSWNDGAGAARIYTLAGFLRHAMPLTTPGTLSDADAQHIAAYINSHERPSFPRKAQDFLSGSVPIDAVYYPQRYSRNPLRP